MSDYKIEEAVRGQIAYPDSYCCAVPCCNSNNKNCPDKSFYPIPSDPVTRRMWLKRANIHVHVSSTHHSFFCEDHFDGKKAYGPSMFQCQYFAEFSIPHPAPPLQESYMIDKRKKMRKLVIKIDAPSNKNTARCNARSLSRSPIKKKITDSKTLKYTTLACVIKLEHNYAISMRPPTKNKLPKNSTKNTTVKHKKDNHQRRTKINDNFLRVNKNHHILVQSINSELNESTDSADSLCTFKCFHCEIEYIHVNELHDHINEKHIHNEQEEALSERTDSAATIRTYKCELCGIEYIHNIDLQTHIMTHMDIVHDSQNEAHGESAYLDDFDEEIGQGLDDFEEPLQHIDDEDVTLDIKPEIFQCSKCPSSFINEEDMTKHLQFMHGNLTDLIKHFIKVTNTKLDAKTGTDLNNSSNNEQCIEIAQEESERESGCEVNLSGYNFGQIETSVEIKREGTDNLEDTDFSFDNQNFGFDEQNLDLDAMYDLNTFLSENTNTNIQEKSEYNINDQELCPNKTNDIKREYVDCQVTGNTDGVATVQCSFKNILSQFDSSQYNQDLQSQQISNSDLALCKTCSMSFPTQVELLDHLHELINTKARLYSEAKRVLKADSVRFKSPYSSDSDKQYLNDAELLDYVHKVFNKKTNKNIFLQVVRYTDEDDNDIVPVVESKICRCCSKMLPKSTVLCKRKDKICRRCKRIERSKERRRRYARAKLYASAKNAQLKNCVDTEKTYDKALTNMLRDKPTKLAVLNEDLERISNISNENEKAKTVTDEDSAQFEENNLLKPIREEEERVIVQPNDPTLCKSCLKPLHGESIENSAVCKKCKGLEASNEERKRLIGKRITADKQLPYVLLHRLPDNYSNKKRCTERDKNGNECHICHLKFDSKLILREHVVQNHL